MKKSLVAFAVSTLVASAAFAEVGDIPLHNWSVPGRTGIQALSETEPLPFMAVTPCRIVDTRGNGAPLTGGHMAASTPRNYALAGQCGVPTSAKAISINITVTSTDGAGYVSVWPQAATQPTVSTLNYLGGQTIANAAVVPIGSSSGVSFACMNAGCDLIVDTNGYYSDTPNTGTNGFHIYVNTGNYAGYFQNSATSCSATCGVYVSAASTTPNAVALQGYASGTSAVNTGVFGNSNGVGSGTYPPVSSSYASGVHGIVNSATSDDVAGVMGETVSSGIHANGVLGLASNSNANAGQFYNAGGPSNVYLATGSDSVLANANLVVFGNSTVSGTKSFITPHPEDPSKEINYVSAEGPTSDVFFRGTASLVGGVARIDVPDSFRLVARDGSYMTTLTPVGNRGSMWVESEGSEGIVVRGTGSTFHYVVWGERAEFQGHEAVQTNVHYRPEYLAKSGALRTLSAATLAILVRNGTVNPDGTFNEATARRLGWAIPVETSAAPVAAGP